MHPPSPARAHRRRHQHRRRTPDYPVFDVVALGLEHSKLGNQACSAAATLSVSAQPGSRAGSGAVHPVGSVQLRQARRPVDVRVRRVHGCPGQDRDEQEDQRRLDGRPLSPALRRVAARFSRRVPATGDAVQLVLGLLVVDADARPHWQCGDGSARSPVWRNAESSNNRAARTPSCDRLSRRASAAGVLKPGHATFYGAPGRCRTACHLWWHPTVVSWFARYLRSSVGAKHVMAVTGLLLLLFAIFHMLGHLQMFGGRDMYNAYAHFLQNLWEVKWPVRAGLLGLLVHPRRARARARREEPRRAPDRLRGVSPGALVVRSAARWRCTGSSCSRSSIFHIIHFTHRQPHRHPGLTRTRCSSTAFQQPLDLRASTSSASCCSRCTSVTARRRGCSRSAGATRSTRPIGSVRIVAVDPVRRLHAPADRRARSA